MDKQVRNCSLCTPQCRDHWLREDGSANRQYFEECVRNPDTWDKEDGTVCTYGGFANGMPKNLLVTPSVTPWKVPLSRVTVGPLAVGAATMQPKRATKTLSARSER